MSVSFVGYNSAAAASATLPTGIQVGDLILVFAYRTTTTSPSLATGYTSKVNGSGNSNAYRFGYKFATSADIAGGATTGTWTNATCVQVAVYRGVLYIGNGYAGTWAASTTVQLPGVAPYLETGNSWYVAMFGSKQATSLSTPTGTTSRGSGTGTSALMRAVDTNGVAAEFPSSTSTAGASATFSTIIYELAGSNGDPAYNFDDNFNQGALSTDWSPGTAGGGSTTQSGGVLNLATAAAAASSANVSSFYTYFMTNRSCSIQVKDAGNLAFASYSVWPIWLVYDASNALGWCIAGTTLYAMKEVAGATTSVATTTYSASTHQYLRVREASGTTYWDYSADGQSWTNFTSTANPIDLSAIKFNMIAQTTATEASANTAKLDNFNIYPGHANTAFSDYGYVNGSGVYANGSAWVGTFGSGAESAYFTMAPIDIPKNATITSAYIVVYAFNFDNAIGTLGLAITAEAADNATPVTTTAGYNALASTTASVTWTRTNLSAGKFKSPDISTVIQELVNRAGWASGNTINILLKNVSTTASTDVNITQNERTRLVVNYTTAAAQTIAASSVTNSSTVAAPQVIKPIVVTSATTANSFGPPTLIKAGFVAPASIINTNSFGPPIVSNYRQYITPVTIGSGLSFGNTFIAAAIRSVFPEEFKNTQLYSTLTIFNKTQWVSPETVRDTIQVPPPAIVGKLGPNDTAPSYQFYDLSVRALRDIAASVLISFPRAYDSGAGLFTVGSSAVDAGQVFRGNGTSIQEWDKFNYGDYSDSLSSFEYHSEQEILGGMVTSFADITLHNSGGQFSPYAGGALAPYILPNRPIRLYAGFVQDQKQVFVGQTMRVPDVTKETAVFHAKDFIASFADETLNNGLIYVNMRTDQIINDILQNQAGLSPTQYSLDTGLNTIGFIEFKAGTTLGDILRDVTRAELGRIYQEADGGLRFRNRNNLTTATAITLRPEYVFDEKEPDDTNVINRVTIASDVRQVLTSRQVYPGLKDGSLTQYDDFQSFKIAAGETLDKFFNFNDPVTTFTHPTVGGGITANGASDGTGANRNSDLTMTVSAVFTDSVKYTFTNSGTTDLYVTALTIQGTPAPVVQQIRVDISDAASITKYGEKLLEIKNNCFSTTSVATTVANAIITQNKDAPSVRQLTIKGLPYLATGNVIKHYDGNNYVIDQISGKHSPSDGHVQSIKLRRV